MTTEASIIAQMPSYLSYAADGTQVLDREALRAWVKAQMTLALGANFWSVSQIDGVLNPALDRLAATLAPAHWSSRSDWPIGSAALLKEANGARTGNVVAAIAKLHSAAYQVSAGYNTINAKITSKITTMAESFFASEGVDGGLPMPVTRVVDSRFYLVTYTTDWGEESAPSPVTAMLEVDQNDTVTVTRTGSLPTGRGTIVSWNLYRSNVGSQDAAFQLVAVVPIAMTSYTDAKKGAELEEVLPTATWLEPPANLQGLTGMANGVMAGFFDSTLCFCEPYVPYAWPVSYQMSVKHPITALAAFGQNLFVGTRGTPYMASGSDSASMTLQELSGGQACVSARSVVAVENGAIYASPDGLCLASFSGVSLLTQELFSREDWQAIKPESIIAALHDNTYYFLWNNGTTSGCYALDFAGKKLIQVDVTGTALYADKVTDTLCVANGPSVTALFSQGRRTGVYRTGIINIAAPHPFSWLQVDSDFSAPVTVRWYGDGTLRYTATVTSIKPVRLPAGRYLEHEIEIESAARITSLTLAGSTQELQQA